MRLVVVGACVATGLTLASVQPAAVPSANAAVPASVALLYKFDSHHGVDVPDSSSSHLNGTLVDVPAPATAYVPSVSGYGRSLKLVASHRQYVAVPEGNALDVNRFTLAALIRYTGVQTADTLGRWEVLEKAGAYWLNIRTTGVVRAGGFFGACGKSANWKFLDSTVAVPTNTWTHVAATYNGTRLTIYINGAAAGSMLVSGTTCTNNQPLAVGAKNAPANGLLQAFWDGQLDEVRIYNKALTASQVRALVP